MADEATATPVKKGRKPTAKANGKTRPSMKAVALDTDSKALIAAAAKGFGWTDARVIRAALKASLGAVVKDGAVDLANPEAINFLRRGLA